MSKCITIFCLLIFSSQSVCLYGQGYFPVHFRFGTELFPDNFEAARQKSPDLSEIANGRYVRYVHTKRLWSTSERTSLSAEGIDILEYISSGTYLLAIPEFYDLERLEPLQVRSILPVQPKWKMARNLIERPFGAWAVYGDQVAVNVQLYPHISMESAVDFCKKSGWEVIETGRTAHFIQLLIPQDLIERIAALPVVQYMELLPAPSEPEDTRGRALHRSNMLDSDAPSGKKYDGSGVNVLVRDNGKLAEHIDLKGRVTNFSTSTPETHGVGVTGILTGAGNLDPTNKGMATGASIYAIDYTSHFQDATLGLFLNENATITNSSYSDGLGCNGGYTLNTKIVDGQLYDYPTLMHVFSAGNSNGIDCGTNTYGAGNQWGNITGGHKQGKNCIAVANLLANTALDNSSSRGPAYDGRIKPDIAAAGNNLVTTAPDNAYQTVSGTSAAAPGIAGCLAQLTQAFKTLHNGQQPPAALLKTLILNSANDLGNEGPDFKFGWGHINAHRALRHIEAAHWSENAIDNGEMNVQTLEIPADVRQAKVMLYWAEAPASEQAAKALINDLDLRLIGPNGAVFLPWKLDPAPNPVTLNSPATRGRDSLNNVEQVSITDPPAGPYTISVSGTEVPMGPQSYFLAWEFQTDSITLTYPNGGEGFVPGETERIYWDARGVAENFVLRYSTDNGGNWLTMTTVAGTARQYDWLVPEAASGKVLVEIQRGGQSDTNDALFSIAPIPQDIAITQVCPDSMRISWTDLQDTLSYDVYLLGDKFMELAGSVASNSIAIPIENPQLEKWVSVRCTSASGITGRRAIAVNSSGGLKNCPLADDLSLNSGIPLENDTLVSCGMLDYNISVQVKNAGSHIISNATIHYQVNNQAVVSEPLPEITSGALLQYTFQNALQLTDNQSVTIRIWTNYPADEYRFNDTSSFSLLYVTQAADAAFSEGFEAAESLPNGWFVKNPDAAAYGISWALSSEGITGANGSPTRALLLDCFSYTDAGEEDYLYLPPLNLNNLANPGISFNIAHATYNSSSAETLRLELFPDCNPQATPVVLWQKTDPQLATVPAITSAYQPLHAEDWRREYVNLQQFAGQSVFVRFASVNGYGNNIFLDNINLDVFENPEATISISEDSICRNDTIYFEAVPTGSAPASYVWNFGLGASPIAANGPGPHAVRYLLAGNKTPRLISSNSFVADTTTGQVYVRPFPISGFTVDANELAVNFTNTSQNASSYFWTFGDGNTSTDTNPEHIYASPGNYVVKLSATNACTTVDKTSIVILTTGTSELTDHLSIRILPNPTDGDFRVELESPETGALRLTLLDAQGRLVKNVEAFVNQPVTTVPFDNLGLAKGAYQLNIQTEHGFRTFSLVVQ